MARQAQLIEQVKELQRSDPEAKQAWWDFCDLQLGGVRDPKRHDEGVLQEFLASWGITVPAGGAGGKAQSYSNNGGARSPGGGYAAQQQGYRQAMQIAQQYSYGGYNMQGAAAAGQADPDMCAFIKVGQRQSHQWKAAWTAYCRIYGNGFNDPSRYDSQFLQNFMDFAGQCMNAHLEEPVQQHMQQQQQLQHQGHVGGPAMKKRPPLTLQGGPPAKRQATGGGGGDGDDQKASLVERVKQLQRRDLESKQAWWKYADEELGGIRDPARHDEEVLQHFLTEHE